jgi:hypothetical protein
MFLFSISLLLVLGIFACSFEVSAQTIPTTASIDTVAAKSYVGKYKVKEGPFEELIVSIQGGKLYGEAVGQGSAVLAATKEADIFEVVGYDGKIEFVRNDQKVIIKAKLTIQGNIIEAEKQP